MTDKELEPWDRAYDDAYGPGYSQKRTHMQIEKQKTTELTRVPRGAWHNRWNLAMPVRWGDGTVSEPGEHLCADAWPSREIAEEKALERLAGALGDAPELRGVVSYIGAEFFPS